MSQITNNCMSCGQCAEFCPHGACVIDESTVSVYKGYYIDNSKCKKCEVCEAVQLCPGN